MLLVVYRYSKFTRITPLLRDLHRLPIKLCFYFKVLLITSSITISRQPYLLRPPPPLPPFIVFFAPSLLAWAIDPFQGGPKLWNELPIHSSLFKLKVSSILSAPPYSPRKKKTYYDLFLSSFPLLHSSYQTVNERFAKASGH